MSSSYACFKRLSAALCGLLLFATSAFSQGHPLPPVENVRSVWNVTGQPCNGNPGSQMRRDKNEAAIRESRRIDLPSVGMSVALPQLPGYSDTAVKLVLDDRSRGVVDHYILFSKNDLDPPSAAIAITELPNQLDTKSKVFRTVVQMERQSAARAGFEPTFQRVSGPFGESLETINPGRIGSHCFPTSDWALAKDSAKDSTLGISRFSLIGNKLVEFALILKVEPQLPFATQANHAQEIMDRFWLALTPQAPVENEPSPPSAQ